MLMLRLLGFVGFDEYVQAGFKVDGSFYFSSIFIELRRLRRKRSGLEEEDIVIDSRVGI
jgi:hypothetical protein